MNILEFYSVSKRYAPLDDRMALTDVSLVLPERSFAALTGPSGSGKTTLLNVASGLDDPTTGHVTVLGQRMDSLDKVARAKFRLNKMGFIFQSYNLLPVLTARENVELSGLLRGLPRAEAEHLAMSALERVGLKDFHKRLPSALSGGQQQRVAVARALANAPQIVFADEPTANLDSTNALQLIKLFKELNQEKGIAFIFSTHDDRLIREVATVVHMKDGTLSPTKE